MRVVGSGASPTYAPAACAARACCSGAPMEPPLRLDIESRALNSTAGGPPGLSLSSSSAFWRSTSARCVLSFVGMMPAAAAAAASADDDADAAQRRRSAAATSSGQRPQRISLSMAAKSALACVKTRVSLVMGGERRRQEDLPVGRHVSARRTAAAAAPTQRTRSSSHAREGQRAPHRRGQRYHRQQRVRARRRHWQSSRAAAPPLPQRCRQKRATTVAPR